LRRTSGNYPFLEVPPLKSEYAVLLANRFRSVFAAEPTTYVQAPGRVNLIGEHTDYNDGFVLPMAIECAVRIALRPRADRRVDLASSNFDQQVAFSMDDIRHDTSKTRWSEYTRGVAWAMQQKGLPLRGVDAVISGDVPIGAGLSSSAAMEVASAWAFQVAGGFRMDPVDMALLCQRAENQWVGMRCGIMDQFISALGERDHCLLVDCRSLTHEAVPLPRGYSFVICNSMVRRGLVDSAYNERRSQCEEGVRLLQKRLPGITALRDVSVQQLERYQTDLPELTYLRCRHIVTENGRVLESVAALKAGRAADFGLLMNASHDSLRDDYQVSRAELDTLVTIARKTPGCLGSRLTGAGFGGCTVSLVQTRAVDSFVQQVSDEYARATKLTPAIYVSGAAPGAGLLQA
jgi:galactokinase